LKLVRKEEIRAAAAAAIDDDEARNFVGTILVW
jgi:hypothetical protein